MMDTTGLLTASLKDLRWGDKVQRVLAAALQAVDPCQATLNRLIMDGETLIAAGRVYDLGSINHIYIVGAGKAGIPMCRAAAFVLGDRLQSGVVIVKDGYQDQADQELLTRIEILPAGHPIPDERGVSATRRITNLLDQAESNDLVLCLISGGGSALLTDPAQGVSLADLQHLTAALLASGATIHEINTLRKHLDRVKGGNLARLAAPASLLTLILADVVGNPMDIVASGPTVPDSSTFAEAMELVQRYQLMDKIPASICTVLEQGIQGLLPENPAPGDPLFEKVKNTIIGSNLQAAEAAINQAGVEGYHPLLLTTYLQGEARQAGRMFAAIARQINATGQPALRPACVIAGGETTVTLRGEGMGGRNQELALGSVEEMDGIPAAALVTLATDGGDGPTDAAGAVVTGETLARARELGMLPAEYLARNDSYHFFEPLGDLLKTGPTQTNVCDLTFLFLDKPVQPPRADQY